MKKNICLVLGMLVIMFLVSGCAKVVKTETSQVKAKVISTYHKSAYSSSSYSRKRHHRVHHSAVWKTTLEYNKKQYVIYGSDTYNFCNNKKGALVMCTFVTKYYDDETTSNEITAVNE